MSSYCIGKPGVYLVTGGSRSGKSKFAERLVSQYDDVAYIATSVITDSEMERRVKKHKASRPNTWKVYEEPYDIKDVIASTEHEVYLVDCLTVLGTNYMFNDGCFEEDADLRLFEETEARYTGYIQETIDEIYAKGKRVVFVTNEVGSGLVPESGVSRAFRDMSGHVNQIVAQDSEAVWLVVSGIPIIIKG